MNSINKIILLSILYFCKFLWADEITQDINAKLYPQLESIILNRPAESIMSVATIYSNYQKISSRWIGKKNTTSNIKLIENNPLFAKTAIFAKSYDHGESAQNVLFIDLNIQQDITEKTTTFQA